MKNELQTIPHFLPHSFPHILNQTISHGRAAEILGIRKAELIDLYDKLGYSYFDMTMDDLDAELNTFREFKKKETTMRNMN